MSNWNDANKVDTEGPEPSPPNATETSHIKLIEKQNRQQLKMQCLQMALSKEDDPAVVITIAKEYYKFVRT